MSERVKIHIDSTNQDTTAIWRLEGIGDCDAWICTLSDIKDFKFFTFWNFSKVKIEFKDGRIREKMFYYDCLRKRLVQVDSDKLSFWTSKDDKEREGKAMVKTVKINHGVHIEGYYLLRAFSDNPGFGKEKNSVKEFDHNPTPEEIATFLVESEADFVSVEHNYRLYKENELPFM